MRARVRHEYCVIEENDEPMNSKQPNVLIILFLLCTCQYAMASKVSGKVTDATGKALPFVTLYAKNTSIGTTTNAEGLYSLELKEGSYDIIFQYVGYKRETRKVIIGKQEVLLNIKMKLEAISLAAVEVKANAEDPAYQIIRNTIKQRKKHLNEVTDFNCDVYIKGFQRLDQAPKKILGTTINVDTGVVYLSESVSKLSFRKPNNVKEKMISSKVSGDNQGFSYNQSSDMQVDFYQNLVRMGNINERGLISPIANNAMLHYNYQLEGVLQEEAVMINKIKVIPIRKNDPVFAGYLYIVEDSWRIARVDLLLTKANQIEFLDSLRITQVHVPIKDDRWMLLSQKFNFKFGVFGFKGSGNFSEVRSNYVLDPVFEKKYFTNEIMSYEEGANKRDSLYWEAIRPIPLTTIEKNDYIIKDSLRIIKDSKPYKDSIDRVENKISLGNIFLTGYTYSKSFKKKYYSINSLTDMLQFNTVEGLVPNLKFTYHKSFENKKSYSITPQIRYGFANHTLRYGLSGEYHYAPKKLSSFHFSIQKFVAQLNEKNPIMPAINTQSTLYYKKNHIKLFEKRAFKVWHQTELINGLTLTSSIEYSNRRQLFNHSEYTWSKKDNREYTPNAPDNMVLKETSFPTHDALIIGINLKWVIGQKYISYPDRKYNLESIYPTIRVNYSKAFSGVLQSALKYDKLQVAVSDHLPLGLLGTSSYSIQAGTFLNKDSLSFIDFHHFNGNQTIFSEFKSDDFQLLDYYRFSTNNAFFQAHYIHHFNGFLINKIPLLRKFKIQTVASINFLTTKALNEYVEFGVGFEHILKVIRVDYFFAHLPGGASRNGVRIGIGF